MRNILLLSSAAVLAVALADKTPPASFLRGDTPGWSTISPILKRTPPQPIASFTTQSQIDQELHRLDALTTDDGPTGGHSHIPKLIPDKDYWNSMYEKLRIGIEGVPELPNPFTTHLIQTLYKAGDTGVYVIEGGKYVIKYHRFCPSELEPIDSMVVEWFFLNDLENTAFATPITHKAVYMSAPVLESRIWPREGKLAKRTSIMCDNWSSVPKIRFMISERTGISVSDFLEKKGGTVDVLTATRMAVQMIRLLEKLHKTKHYIHGDVHGGNFAVSSKNPHQLILIDFGRARLVDEDMFPDAENTFMFDTGDAVQCHMFWSQWQSRGRVGSFRDDVYRALTLIAQSIHGNAFIHAVNGFCEAAEYYGIGPTRNDDKRDEWVEMYLDFKGKLNFFDVPYVERFIPNVRTGPPQYYDLSLYSIIRGTVLQNHYFFISRSFERALEVVRATRIQEIPSYSQILEELFAIIKRAPGEDQVNPSTFIDFN